MTPMLWLAMWLAGAPQAPIDPAFRIEMSASGYRTAGPYAARDLEIRSTDLKTLWVDPVNCSGSTSRIASPSAVSWETSGRIIQQNGETFVIEVNVHRSDKDPMPPRTISVALGERVLLDELPSDPKRCWSVVRLEVGIARQGVRSGVMTGAAGGVGAGPVDRVSSGASGSGAAGGIVGGAVTGVTTAVGAGPRSGVSGGGGGGAASGSIAGGGGGGGGRGGASGSGDAIRHAPMSAAMFATATGMGQTGTVTKNGVPLTDHPVPMHPIDDASYDAEVWLVHRIPQGKEETVKQTGHIGREGRVFEFPAMHVSTDNGIVDVDIAGLVRPMTLDDGTVVLRAAIARVLGGIANSVGSSVTAIPMPGPSDAVSFEIPLVPARVAATDPLPGHQFSITVRIVRGK